MNRVVHFEIHAANPERAATFYKNIFGWEIKEWVMPGMEVSPENRYWLVTTGQSQPGEVWPGINGGIVVRKGAEPVVGQPVNSYVCTIAVENLDTTLEKTISSGGVLALPKMEIKGVGWLAYCKDTEGNLFGIMQAMPQQAA